MTKRIKSLKRNAHLNERLSHIYAIVTKENYLITKQILYCLGSLSKPYFIHMIHILTLDSN